tara:strand:- start:246 stop:1001 length:756 start_codon:yes stop_codon:yes gene_type:complete
MNNNKLKHFCIANWKMSLNNKESIDYINRLNKFDFNGSTKIVICPSYTSISDVEKLNINSIYSVGGQDISLFDSGAYTGQISINMLENLSCKYVIIGHSERREHCGESDCSVHDKLRKVSNSSLTPIVCIGESLMERKNGSYLDVIENQLNTILKGQNLNNKKDLIIAYEPIWAIGTGESADVETIHKMHLHIKNITKKIITNNCNIYLLYGGSVNVSNAEDIINIADVDGFLIGSASLDPDVFYSIYNKL